MHYAAKFFNSAVGTSNNTARSNEPADPATNRRIPLFVCAAGFQKHRGRPAESADPAMLGRIQFD